MAQERQSPSALVTPGNQEVFVSSKTGRRFILPPLGQLAYAPMSPAQQTVLTAGLVQHNPGLAPFLHAQVTAPFIEPRLPTHPTLVRNMQEGRVPMNMADRSDPARRKRAQEYLELCNANLRLYPNDAENLRDKAWALDELAQYEEALQTIDQAIRIDPKNSRAYSIKASALGGLERHEEAIEASDQAIRLDAKNSRAYSHKGYSLLNLGRHEEALVAYDEAIRLEPTSHKFTQKCYLLFTLGRKQEALEASNEAIRRDPYDNSLLERKVSILKALGKSEEAEMVEAERKEQSARRLLPRRRPGSFADDSPIGRGYVSGITGGHRGPGWYSPNDPLRPRGGMTIYEHNDPSAPRGAPKFRDPNSRGGPGITKGGPGERH